MVENRRIPNTVLAVAAITGGVGQDEQEQYGVVVGRQVEKSIYFKL